MRKIILFTLLSLLATNVKSQINFTKPSSVSISYWGYGIFHPGFKVGTNFNLKTWDKDIQRRKNAFTKQKMFFVSPQVGLYHHTKNHTGLIFNADVGIEKSREGRKFYTAPSAGLGILTQINSGETFVLKSDGTITSQKSSSRTYFMASYNYEIGEHYNSFSWFTKFSLASKFKYNTGTTLNIYLEAGLKFNL